MKVILLESIPTLGDVGEIVNVKDGYARNFLLPRKLASRANERRIAEFNNLKKLAEAKAKKIRDASQEIKRKLEELSINLERKAGQNEKLFGSVTNMDIAAALTERGFEISRRQIHLEEPIKKLGVYNIPVQLAGAVDATVKVWVANSEAAEEEPKA